MEAKPNDAEITMSLWECQHCGELAQLEIRMQHIGCAKDHEYGVHPTASIIQRRIVVQPVEYAD